MLNPKPTTDTPDQPAAVPPVDPTPVLRALIHEALQGAMAGIQMQAGQAASQAAVGAVRGSALGVFHAVAAILAVRLLLLLSVVASFALAVYALKLGSYQALGVLVAFAVLILLPLIWLERTPRTGVKTDG